MKCGATAPTSKPMQQTVNEYPVTLWQCVRALDPSYQSGKPGGWLRIPTREEVLRILRATGMVTEVRKAKPPMPAIHRPILNSGSPAIPPLA